MHAKPLSDSHSSTCWRTLSGNQVKLNKWERFIRICQICGLCNTLALKNRYGFTVTDYIVRYGRKDTVERFCNYLESTNEYGIDVSALLEARTSGYVTPAELAYLRGKFSTEIFTYLVEEKRAPFSAVSFWYCSQEDHLKGI